LKSDEDKQLKEELLMCVERLKVGNFCCEKPYSKQNRIKTKNIF
jgi:hypothetical protein